MSSPADELRTQVQALADALVPRSPRLAALNDQAVVDTIIRSYFQSLPEPLPQPRLVDVGAAYGAVSAPFLKDGWTADLFEPDPACQAVLQKLIEQHPRRARLHRVAVSDHDAPAAPFHQNALPGLSGLAPSPFGQPQRTLEVQLVYLGDYLRQLDLPRLDFLKIDTEGNDFDILEAHCWELLPPPLVFVEYSFYFPGQDAALLRRALASMHCRGYAGAIFDYEDDGNFKRGSWQHRLIAMHLDGQRLPDRPTSFGNILFYRRDDLLILQVIAAILHALK